MTTLSKAFIKSQYAMSIHPPSSSISFQLSITRRSSDGCNRSHNVSLPIILKKTKVGLILQFSCISLLLVPILLYWI